VNREMQNGDVAHGGGEMVFVRGSGLPGSRREMHRSDGSRAALSWRSRETGSSAPKKQAGMRHHAQALSANVNNNNNKLLHPQYYTIFL